MLKVSRTKVGSVVFSVVVVSGVLLSVSACDALSGGGKIAGSCDWRPTNKDRCFEYPDADAKKDCTAGRVWKAGPCDHTGAVCGARLSSGVQKWIFATAGTTKEKATAECAQDKVLGPDGKPVP